MATKHLPVWVGKPKNREYRLIRSGDFLLGTYAHALMYASLGHNCAMIQIAQARFDRSALALCCVASGTRISLRAQSVRVLEALLDAQGAMLSKNQLAQTVWGNVAVTDDSLVQCIKEIRCAVKDVRHEWIQTVRRRGYRLDLTPVQIESERLAVAQSRQLLPGKPLIPALAVLGLNTFKADEHCQSLAHQLTNELTAQLLKHRELRLVSRQSAMALQGQDLDAHSICDRLGVRYFVTGQVQVNGPSLNYIVELIDGIADRILYSDEVNLALIDFDSSHADLIFRSAAAIRLAIDRANREHANECALTDLDAFELCDRAYAALLRTSIDTTAQAQKIATFTVERHPDYARAWRVLAETQMWDLMYGLTGRFDPSGIQPVLGHAHKAVLLDSTQASAYNILSIALCFNAQLDEAMMASDSALALAPGELIVLHLRAEVQFYRGEFEQALASSEASLHLSPTVKVHATLAVNGCILYFMNQREKGVKRLLEAVTLAPASNWARIALVLAYYEADDMSRASEHFQLLLAHTTQFSPSYFARQFDAIPKVRSRFLKAFAAMGMASINNDLEYPQLAYRI
jgi:DNA-binding winged helix-turn-helix (wHTH) protein/tetratricopeptide (TPR) repeat protein